MELPARNLPRSPLGPLVAGLALTAASLTAGCRRDPAGDAATRTTASASKIVDPAASLGSVKTSPEETRSMADSVPTSGENPTGKVVRSDAQWKELLSPEAYRVLRQQGTEAPFRNAFDDHFEPGEYACGGCGQVLFASDAKFNSGCGWPAFYAAQAADRVVLRVDRSHGMVRTEVVCARCESHLGHVFDDAPQTPTGQRFCINSVALEFVPASPKPE